MELTREDKELILLTLHSEKTALSQTMFNKAINDEMTKNELQNALKRLDNVIDKVKNI